MGQLIGYNVSSQLNNTVAYIIIVCLVVDMIFLPVLIGANFSEYTTFSKFYTFKGAYTDFNDEWYSQIGSQLVKTMIIFTFQPFIDFLVEIITARIYVYMANKNCDKLDPNILDVKSTLD